MMVTVKDSRLEDLEELAADLRVEVDTTDQQGKSLEEVARDSKILEIMDKAKQRREEKVDKGAAKRVVTGFAGRSLQSSLPTLHAAWGPHRGHGGDHMAEVACGITSSGRQ